MQAEITISKPKPTVAYIALVAMIIFGGAFLGFAAGVLYSLTIGTFANMLGCIAGMALTAYLTKFFYGQYWSGLYNFALEENTYSAATGNTLSKLSNDILKGRYAEGTNEVEEKIYQEVTKKERLDVRC